MKPSGTRLGSVTRSAAKLRIKKKRRNISLKVWKIYKTVMQMFQGQKHALQAVDLNEGDFESLRWAAVTTGQLTDHLGTKEKIEQGAKFKVFASVTNVSQC